MITLAELAYWALMCAYDPIKPGIFTQVLQVGDITVCIIAQPGRTIIVFPGTEQFMRDLVDHDLDAMPIEVDGLGILHHGFYDGMPAVIAAIRPLLFGDIYVAGHSLGGSRAALCVAMLGQLGIKVRFVALFEAARPGCAQFQSVLKGYLNGYFSCVNGLSFVTDLPPDPFLRPIEDYTRMNAKPGGFADLAPISYHLGKTLYPGVLALPNANVPI